MRGLVLAAVAVVLSAGCRSSWVREEIISTDAQRTLQDAELRFKETRTLSALAKLEEAVAAYIRTERRIPEKLGTLIPKYLAEMPSVELGVRGHKDTAEVRYYGREVLRDGRVDGTRLKDSGRWGYVHNDNRVVVFVDCTHKRHDGGPWYQTRGVY